MGNNYFSCRERNLTEILELLWPFRTVQPRMIRQESLLTRQAGSVPSLQGLSRDTILILTATNINNQERLAGPVVERLAKQENLTTTVTEFLLHTYSDRMSPRST